MEQLPQLQARSFQRVGVMAPVAPTRSDGQDGGVHEGDCPRSKNLRVFVVLNAVADGLKAYPRRRFAGGDWTWRVEKIPSPGLPSPPPQAVVSTLFQLPIVFPAVHHRSGNKGYLSRLASNSRTLPDALVDRRIVYHPLRSIAEAGVTTGIAPEIAMGERETATVAGNRAAPNDRLPPYRFESTALMVIIVFTVRFADEHWCPWS